MKNFPERIFAFAWLAALLLAVSCINDERSSGIDLKPGDGLPGFSVIMNDGATVSASDLAGAPAMIVFFNTGCPDCRKELPEVQKFYEEYGSRVRVICISREQGAEEIGKWWAENGITLPYSAQTDRKVYNLFASSVIPRVYLADSESVIRNVFTDDPIASFEVLSEAAKALN